MMTDESWGVTIARLEIATEKIIGALLKIQARAELEGVDMGLDLDMLEAIREVYSEPGRYLPYALSAIADDPEEGKEGG